MEFQNWLKSLPGSPTVSQAANHAKISKATLLRHAKKGETTAEYAVAISRSYNVNEIESLVALGLVSADAVAEIGIVRALKRADNQQLLDEILRRSDPTARYLFGADEETIGLADDGTVSEFTFLPEQYAADSSEDMTELRLERGEDPID